MTPELLQSLQEKIHGARSIALFGHDSIDGDAIGSVLGFGAILEKLGKQIAYFTPSTPARGYSFVKNIDKIQTMFDYGTYDLLIFLDFTPYGRIGAFTKGHEDYFDKQYKIIIDHHINTEGVPGEENKGDLVIKDIQSTSNCGWLYEICSQFWDTYIDETVATYWYMGLLTDSGNFMYGDQAERDFGIAQKLIQHGAQKATIIQNIFFSSQPGVLEIAKLMLQRAKVDKNVLYTYYTKEEIVTNDISEEDTESTQSILRSIVGNPVFLRLRYMQDVRHGSLRSGYLPNGNRIDVQKIATAFGGGGHKYASGFHAPIDTTKSLEEQVAGIVGKVNEEIAKQL